MSARGVVGVAVGVWLIAQIGPVPAEWWFLPILVAVGLVARRFVEKLLAHPDDPHDG